MKVILKLNFPPKVKIFCWLLRRGQLKTKDGFGRYQPNVNQFCVLCSTHVETYRSIFFFCDSSFAASVSSLTGLSETLFQTTNLITWIYDLLINSHDKGLLAHYLLIYWHIWDTRNHWIFR